MAKPTATFTIEPGRNIYRNGKPFLYLGQCSPDVAGTNYAPVWADEIARRVCVMLNEDTRRRGWKPEYALADKGTA